MVSSTNICNMALAAIGTRSTIQSMTDGSEEADACAIQYMPSLLETLRMHNWAFARKQLPLGLFGSAAAGNALPPYAYEYYYPADCVKARSILPSYAAPTITQPTYMGPPIKFEESLDVDAYGNDMKVILTNQPSATLVYTKVVTSVNLFDPLFVRAFSLVMGSRMAIQLTGDKGIKDRAMKDAETAVALAEGIDGNEGLVTQNREADWIRVRGYASDYAGYGNWDFYNPLFPIS